MKRFVYIVLVFTLFVGCSAEMDTDFSVKETFPDGSSIVVLKDRTGYRMEAALSPDGKKVVTTLDGTVRIWDSESGKELKKIRTNMSSVTFSPDGQRIVENGYNSVITILDVHSGKKLKTINGIYEGNIVDADSLVAFSQDGRRIAIEAPGAIIRILDVNTGKVLRKWRGDHDRHDSIFFSPDGKKIVAGRRTMSTFVVYNIDTGRELLRLEAKWHGFWSVVFSPDGQKILTIEGGRPEVATWDIDSKKELQRIRLGARSIGDPDVSFATFSPDRTQIITTRTRARTLEPEAERPYEITGHIFQVWDANSWEELHKWEEPGCEGSFCYFSPDGAKFATVSINFLEKLSHGSEMTKHTFRIYDINSGKKLKELEWPDDALFYSLVFSLDGEKLTAIGRSQPAPDVDSNIIVQTWILE